MSLYLSDLSFPPSLPSFHRTSQTFELQHLRVHWLDARPYPAIQAAIHTTHPITLNGTITWYLHPRPTLNPWLSTDRIMKELCSARNCQHMLLSLRSLCSAPSLLSLRCTPICS